MTAPPLPTFVPQDAWYNLTTGNINPSIADSVPDISYLQPTGSQDGLVGSLDGGVIWLRGLASELDGGQKMLMWVADSLAVDDGVNTFCPYVATSTPGRWVNYGTTTQGTGAVISTQTVVGGTTTAITPRRTPFIYVQVKGGAGATTVSLPNTTFAGQMVRVKDGNGTASSATITVTAANIDGATSYTLVADYQEAAFVWSGTQWSVA